MIIKILTKKFTPATYLAMVCVMFVFFSIYFGAMAQENNQNQEGETKDIICVIEMKPFLKEKSEEFAKYLTQHFQNKSVNSSLLYLALERFQEYKSDLNEEFRTYYPQAGLPQYSESADLLACHNQMNEEIKIMEALLEKFYLETSSVKTTSTHMSKLKNINEKLDQLNRGVTQLYGNWASLEKKIPCYVSSCISG